MSQRLTHDDVEAAGLDDWRFLRHALQTRFRTRDYATGLRLVSAIGAAAEAADHHPDLDLRYRHLNVRLSSHDVKGVTDRDLALAGRISAIAADAGAVAAPSEVELVEIGLDTPDRSRITPFWRAITGYHDHPDPDVGDALRDDAADLPLLWFQPSGDEEPRQRFHLDITVPRELARERIEATVAAGGTVVDEQPTFVVLEDPDGNRACVCF